MCVYCLLYFLCIYTIHDTVCVVSQKVLVYLDFAADESYTPSKISVLAGSYYHDLQVSTNSGLGLVGCPYTVNVCVLYKLHVVSSAH